MRRLFAIEEYIHFYNTKYCQKRPEVACDEHLSAIDYRINRRPGKLPHVSDNAIDWERYIENRKSSCAVRWSTHSESSSACLAIGKHSKCPLCEMNASQSG